MEQSEEIDPALVLEQAADWQLRSVVVCGGADDGSFVWGSSTSSAPEVLFLLEAAKLALMQQAIDDSPTRH